MPEALPETLEEPDSRRLRSDLGADNDEALIAITMDDVIAYKLDLALVGDELFLAGKGRSREISLKKFSSKERAMFETAMFDTEWGSFVLPKEAHDQLRHGVAGKAKPRWRVAGCEDPELTSIERAAPTLTKESERTIFFLAAQHRWPLNFADVKTALLMGKPQHRAQGRLYAYQPPGGIRGLHRDQIVELLTTLYGLSLIHI